MSFAVGALHMVATPVLLNVGFTFGTLLRVALDPTCRFIIGTHTRTKTALPRIFTFPAGDDITQRIHSIVVRHERGPTFFGHKIIVIHHKLDYMHPKGQIAKVEYIHNNQIITDQRNDTAELNQRITNGLQGRSSTGVEDNSCLYLRVNDGYQ